MPKITEYPKATSFDANDVLLKDGTNGTKKIEIEDFISNVSDTTNGTSGRLAKASDVADVKNAFNATLSSVEWAPLLYKGQYIDSVNGIVIDDDSAAAKRCARTNLWNGAGYRIAVNLNNSDYEYRVIYYDENGSLSASAGSNGFVGRSEFASGLQYIPAYAILFALSIRRVDKANMTDAYVAEITAALSLYTVTDDTLTKRSIAADAKTVGDKFNSSIKSLPITDILFPKETIGLAYSGSSATNKRLVDIRHNYITVRPNADNPTGSTYQSYLISGEHPHYVSNTISNAVAALTADDFIPISNFSAGSPLYFSMSKTTNAAAIGQDARIHFVSRNPETGVKTTSTAFVLYESKAGNSGLYRLSDYYLPSIVNDRCLAVVLETRYPNVSADIKIEVFQSTFRIFSTFASPGDSLGTEAAYRPLPKYWQDEISTSVSSIHANQMAASYNSSTICFITDCHWSDNKKYSPRLVKDIIDKCDIDYFVNGGDIILDYNPEKDAAVNELWSCINAFRNVGLPMITLYGNHDRNRDGNPNRDDDNYALTRKEHLNIVYKSFWNAPGLTFYTAPGENQWDLVYWEDQNYRYVVTYWYLQNTSRMPAALMTEMFNTNKKVVIFNHGIYFTLSEDMSRDVIQGGWVLADCEPYKNQIRCIIQGHSHADGLRWAYDGLVPIIILDCDRFRDTKSIAGTASEQCVSVLTIDSSSIKIVRIGRGVDLEITQNTSPFLVKYTDYSPSVVECTDGNT